MALLYQQPCLDATGQAGTEGVQLQLPDRRLRQFSVAVRCDALQYPLPARRLRRQNCRRRPPPPFHHQYAQRQRLRHWP